MSRARYPQPSLASTREPTERQLGMLRALAERGEPGMSSNRCGRLIGITSHGSAENLLNGLEARRLIDLSPTGAFVRLTEAGRALVAGEARAAS